MIVYAVSSGSYSDYSIEAIFSTRERAEHYALILSEANDVEEYELDKSYEPPEYIRVNINDRSIWFCGEWKDSSWCIEQTHSEYSNIATVKVKYNINPKVMKKAAYDRLAELKALEAGI